MKKGLVLVRAPSKQRTLFPAVLEQLKGHLCPNEPFRQLKGGTIMPNEPSASYPTTKTQAHKNHIVDDRTDTVKKISAINFQRRRGLYPQIVVQGNSPA